MSKISEKQKNMLIECVKSDANLISGKFSNSFTYKDAEKRWINISNILNAIPGTSKNWKSWRKTWQDMRSRTKCKFAANKRNLMGTGGGPYVEEPISNADEEILNIIKPVCLFGHVDVLESNVPNFNENNKEIEPSQPRPPSPINVETMVPNQPNVEATTAAITNKPRVLAKRGGIKLRKSERAAAQYERMLDKKIEVKEAYYKKKLELLEEKNLINKEKNNILKNGFIKMNEFLEQLI